MKAALKKVAEINGVGYKEIATKKVAFSCRFNPDFEWHSTSIILWWEESPKGGLNWWTDYVYDGRHRISGPGYPAYAIKDQDPVSEDELVRLAGDMVKNYFKMFKEYEYEKS